MKLRWTHRAKIDLVEIGRYIARDKRDAARRWVQTLRSQARQAAEHPMSGRLVPELPRDDVREIIYSGYRIIYQIREQEVFVLTVLEGHRRLQGLVIDDDPGSD